MPLLGSALAAVVLASCALSGTPAAATPPGRTEQATATPTPAPTVAAGTLVEVRARGSAGGPGDATLAADVLEKVKAIAGVARVDVYLFGKAADGTAADGTVIVGLDPLEAPLRTATGQVLKAEILGGRPWVKGDDAKPVAYVGKAYGDMRKTQFGAIVSQMISPSHAPFVDLGGDNVVNVRAVIETGSSEGNAQVFVPLAFAQEMFARPGRVSKAYVTVKFADERDAVVQAIRAALGDAAQVGSAGP